MAKKYKITAAVVSALAVVLLAFWISQHPYCVENDNSNLEEELLHFFTRDPAVPSASPLNIHDTTTIGKTRYVTYELGEELSLGRAILTQGLNGRWRIDTTGYSGGNFRDDILEIDGADYLFFSGRNPGSAIDRVTAKLGNDLYELELPDQDRFLVSTEVEISEDQDHILPEDFHFYDAAGQDITADIRWN